MQDYNYIRQLLVKDQFGELSEEELQFLNQVLLTDPEVRRLQQVVLNVDLPEAELAANELDMDDAFHRMLSKKVAIRRRKIRSRIIYTGSMAALLAGCIAFILLRNDVVDPSGAPTITADKTVLRTAGGKQIVLESEGQQSIDLDGARLANNNRVLSLAALNHNEQLKGWNTISVPRKLDYRIELSDGTTVWLNSTTQFRFPFHFDGNTREVYIDAGEAYFAVSGKASAPFIVHTRQGDVRVLGTEFNVNSYATDKVVTSLVNGAVLVSGGTAEHKLAPLQEAVSSGGNIKVQAFEPSNIASWRSGIHYFHDASVSEIAAMLQRWFDVSLIIDDAAVSDIRFHASMNRNKPLSFFVETMNLTGEARFYFKNGNLHCARP